MVAAALWLVMSGWMFATHAWGSLPAVVDGCGSPAPDVRFAPDADAVAAFMAGCRSAGSAAYLHLQVLDLLFPSVTAAFLVAALLLLTRRRRSLRWLVVLPLLVAVGDYVENVGAWALLAGGDPTWAYRLVQLGSAVKNVLSWASWLALIVLVVASIGAARRHRRRPRAQSMGRSTSSGAEAHDPAAAELIGSGPGASRTGSIVGLRDR